MNLFKDAKLLQTKKISKFAEESDDFKAEVIIAIGRFFNNDWGVSAMRIRSAITSQFPIVKW